MKKIVTYLLLLIFCNIVISEGYSQQPGINAPRTQEDINKDDLERRMNTMRNADVLLRRTDKQQRETILTKYYKPIKSEELIKQLEINQQLFVEHQSFLQIPNAGVFKILPLADCSKIKSLKKLEKCYQSNSNIKEFANAFSFRENGLTVFAKSDLSINKGFIIAGRHSIQSFIVKLGDVAINEIKLNSPGISYLASFKPAENAKKIDEEFDMFKNGITIGDYSNGKVNASFSYSKVSKIEKNQTYALRSVAYRSEGSTPLEKDKDVIIAFRILAFDEDGAVTILWKELNRKEGLEMKFEDSELKTNS